jgi:N-methylhydantoinase A/oxoprolinase/acetone carboxylase beta subunit
MTVDEEFASVSFRGQTESCRYYWRESLPSGFTEAGLAIVEEPTATTLIPPGWRFSVGPAGALILERETV